MGKPLLWRMLRALAAFFALWLIAQPLLQQAPGALTGIVRAFAVTATYVLCALAICLCAGTFAGMFGARRALSHKQSSAVWPFSLLFVLIIGFVFFAAMRLNTQANAVNIALAVLLISLPPALLIARVMKSALMQEFQEPYVKTALNQGYSIPQVLRSHALRHALPVVLNRIPLCATLICVLQTILEPALHISGGGALLFECIAQGDLFHAAVLLLYIAALLILLRMMGDIAQGILLMAPGYTQRLQSWKYNAHWGNRPAPRGAWKRPILKVLAAATVLLCAFLIYLPSRVVNTGADAMAQITVLAGSTVFIALYTALGCTVVGFVLTWVLQMLPRAVALLLRGVLNCFSAIPAFCLLPLLLMELPPSQINALIAFGAVFLPQFILVLDAKWQYVRDQAYYIVGAASPPPAFARLYAQDLRPLGPTLLCQALMLFAASLFAGMALSLTPLLKGVFAVTAQAPAWSLAATLGFACVLALLFTLNWCIAIVLHFYMRPAVWKGWRES